MGAFWIGALCGAPVGAALAALTRLLWIRRHHQPMTDIDLAQADSGTRRAALSTHAEVMRQQVAHFADTLAGDDLVLRERLRRFEWGGSRS